MELLKILIPAGLDVNYNEDHMGGFVPFTITRNQIEFTKYLLDQGADLNISPMQDLYPALNVAVGRNLGEMAELLIQYSARVNGLGALAEAARSHCFDMMELLFRHGADVNDDAKDRLEMCVDYWGRTVLHEAANMGHLDVVQFLLDKEANPDLKNDEGQTPLMMAQENNRIEVVQFLDDLQK